MAERPVENFDPRATQADENEDGAESSVKREVEVKGWTAQNGGHGPKTVLDILVRPPANLPILDMRSHTNGLQPEHLTYESPVLVNSVDE